VLASHGFRSTPAQLTDQDDKLGVQLRMGFAVLTLAYFPRLRSRAPRSFGTPYREFVKERLEQAGRTPGLTTGGRGHDDHQRS
jgi:hypothetical protein